MTAEQTATHTPGPWFWAFDKDNRPTDLMRSGTGDYVLSPQADLNTYGLSMDRWTDANEADCALISASPDAFDLILTFRDYAKDMLAGPNGKQYSRLGHDDLTRIDAYLTQVLGVQHFSDCATHNEPAMPKGPCDCGAVDAALAEGRS